MKDYKLKLRNLRDSHALGLDVMGDPSILNTIRKDVVLERDNPTLFFSCEEKVARRKWNWPRSCSTI